MKILITGASGFLGSHLTAFLRDHGHAVIATSRSSKDFPVVLGDSVSEKLLVGIDVVIHGAHDFGRGNQNLNIEGTRTIYLAAQAAGVPKQIFISSFSARPDALSEYGKTKYQIESFFLSQGQWVIRPGLVIGNGGLFARNLKAILKSPLLPLPGGGKDLVPLLFIGDFLSSVEKILNQNSPRAFNLFNHTLVSNRDLIEEINRAGAHRALLVSLPLGMALTALRFLKFLKIKLPLDPESLKSGKLNQSHPFRSDLLQLLGRETPFREMVQFSVDKVRSGSTHL